MPTKRFYNLSAEKKNLIRDAAIEEFVNASIEKASINKIIQKAGISRGSFYTYFNDKHDVLEYIFEDAAENLQQGWLKCAEKNSGDLWKTAETFMDYSFMNTKRSLIELGKDIVESKKLFGVTHQLCKNKQAGLIALQEAMYQSIDKTNFKDQSFETFNKLLNMIFVNLTQCIMWHHHYPQDKEKVKKIFKEKLEILQYGICKE